MSPCRPFVFVVLACLSYASNGYAQSDLPPVTPYRPHLTQDRDPALCGAFLSAWTQVFDSEKPLGEQWLDLKGVFSGAEIFTFPPVRPRPGQGFGGLYDRAFTRALDFDGDGVDELLYAQGHQSGWRYLGADLYLFDSEAAYREAKTAFEKEQPAYKRFRLDHLKDEELQQFPGTPMRLLRLRPSDVVYVLSLNDELYVTGAPSRRWINRWPISARLVHLNGGTAPETVCSVELLPSTKDFQAFNLISAFYQALKSMYGGEKHMCQGSMGWTAPPVEEPLVALFHRPRSMDAAPTTDDVARELRPLAWGVSDPVSWSVYRQFKANREGFVRQMASYYRHYFADTEAQAARRAEQAARFIIDQIFYSRNDDGYHLTRVAQLPGPSIAIGSGSSPEAIAAAAIGHWLDANRQQKDKPQWGGENIWREAVLAALYTRQDAELIETLKARLDGILDAREAAAPSEMAKARLVSEREEQLSAMFVAALGDRPLMEMALSRGADVNAGTNWFGKTPLMYAAQMDDLATTEFLLARGAAPSARTKVDHYCKHLDRDGRTPLMYAAENASPKLIEEILDAGADARTVDSKGNEAIWYLERNPGLTVETKEYLQRRIMAAR